MTIEIDLFTLALLGVLWLWHIASVCKAYLNAQAAKAREKNNAQATKAKDREESIRLQMLLRAMGRDAGPTLQSLNSHPNPYPIPPRPPA